MTKIVFLVALVCLTFTAVSLGEGDSPAFDNADLQAKLAEAMKNANLGSDSEGVKDDMDDDDDDDFEMPKVDKMLADNGMKTNAGSKEIEDEAIKIDELNTAQFKELRASAEKHQFQTEVNRMMKLIINSLYKNKEIFLRELISNASDALDKLRLNSITDSSLLAPNPNMDIRIRIDKENKYLHIIDTGIGMTKDELVRNLGTIAKSGTSDFLNQMQKNEGEGEQVSSDLIGQFGVGFYSSFLVADKVIVTSKSNEDASQHIWESDSSQFNIIEDPRGPTLQRGTQITLALKQEALNYLEESTVRDLIKKYSQFINFPIYLWTEKTIEEEVPIEEDEKDKAADKEDKTTEEDDDDDDAKVEESSDEAKPKTKKVSKTVYDWELINHSKPIWLRKPAEIEEKEYNEFYKTLTKDSADPMSNTHFVAEGEVTFKSLLYVPSVQPSESFNRYGTKVDNIKLYVRRVFITDDFNDIIPPYLNFLRGIVDSDDLPLNVSRENLQQSKLMKIIRKKLIRKTLDMIKKLSPEQFDKFWKEYSTNIKLGVIEDTSNRSRLSKLLKFTSSQGGMTNLADYITRMKEKQEAIYYIAGSSMDEVKKSPFTEKLLKRGYEVLYLTEPIDEYCINSIADFEGKKFQNVAKEGLTMKTNEEKLKELKNIYEPLTKWFTDNALKDLILKAELSDRLDTSPVALVTSRYGWTGNMERIISSQTHSKADDVSRQYYMNQKKTLEVNPRHPLIKELLRRVKDDVEDPVAKQMSNLLFHTATLRSGYTVKDTDTFISSIESMMRGSLGIPLDEEVDEDDMEEATEEEKEKDEAPEDLEADADEEEKTEEEKSEEEVGGDQEQEDESALPMTDDDEEPILKDEL